MRSTANREPGQTVRTYASEVYSSLRGDIIAGAWVPGARLRFKDICERYKVGLSPTREALNRLAAEGLVAQTDHKGFAVAEVSPEDLVDITHLRCWLNEGALRASIAHGDEAWEEGIALAFHRMTRVPRFNDGAPPTPNPVWDARHRAFHASLLAACPSRRLLAACEHSFDQMDRYRALAAVSNVEETIAGSVDDHRSMMEAVLARDADRAVEQLVMHMKGTCERLLAKWNEALHHRGPRR